MVEIPDWALKYKTKRTAINCVNGNFYLYKISSKWDPTKKRAKKITECYLGKITSEGVVPAKHKRTTVSLKNVTIKEFGASALVNYLSQKFQAKLKKVYSDDCSSIFAIAAMRFMHNSPIKNMGHHFEHSYLSTLLKDVNMSTKYISAMIEKLGADREKMVLFMRQLPQIPSENLIVDMTHIFSASENINWLSIGHNAHGQFHSQLNMLLFFSNDRMTPIYFRLLPGAIRDVSAIKETLVESKINSAIFVGDKGFQSENNEECFKNHGLKYILPMKRNNSLIDYDVMKESDRKKFDGFFFFQKRHIWYKEKKLNDEKKIALFFDQHLRVDEENSFLERLSKIPELQKEEKENQIKDFYEKQYCLGTICIATNTKLNADKIYHYLKARVNIEIAFDTFKNILEADKTYMRSTEQMYGWTFINFLSLIMYYQIYGILVTKLIKKEAMITHYSPKDILMHFSKVYTVKVSDEESISEIPKKTRILREMMDLDENLLLKLRS